MEVVTTELPVNLVMSATTEEESIPPERKAPKGTSLIKRSRTASSSVSKILSHHSSSDRFCLSQIQRLRQTARPKNP